MKWPTKTDPGIFKVACTCNKWQSIGTAEQITREAASHDDSPQGNHVVYIVCEIEK